MAARSLFKVITKPATWALGLDKPDSIATIVRQCRHTLGVSRDFLESPSANLVNPQHRPIKSDTTSLSLTASTFHGLSDEKLLALFTKGFFGGWVFFLESLALKAGVWKLSPVIFTGMLASLSRPQTQLAQRKQVSRTDLGKGKYGPSPASRARLSLLSEIHCFVHSNSLIYILPVKATQVHH